MDNPEKTKPGKFHWTGRDDTVNEGAKALRWHQCVKPLLAESDSGIVIQGFACDIGIRRNEGRVGAAEGPPALRRSLGRLSWLQEHPAYDAGDIVGVGGDLKTAQEQLAEAVAKSIRSDHRPIVLGGGHETSWGTFQGITRAHPGATVGIINLDSHFDLRAGGKASSGTPFQQIASWCKTADLPFLYLAIGIAEASNTQALFDQAKRLEVRWMRDCDPVSAAQIVTLIEQCDVVHLSLDLDVLPWYVMPAVSAPSGRGLDLAAVEFVLDLALSSNKVAAVDVVEFNPMYDIDHNGGRVAAALIWRIARNWRQAPIIKKP